MYTGRRFVYSADLSGINETLVEGDPLQLELRNVEGFWAATLEGVQVSGRPIELSTNIAILDSGDSYITLPPKDYAVLMAALSAQPLGHDWDNTGYAGMHYVSCSALSKLDVAFMFAGRRFSLHPYDLVTPVGGVCVLSNVNTASHVRGVLLGVPFLMNVYTVFGLNPPSLSLYTLKKQHNPPWRLRITEDGSVVAPTRVLGLTGELLPDQLTVLLCLLALMLLGALIVSALRAVPRPRHHSTPDGTKYTLLQRLPGMGW